jgi:hypothetical protein
MAVCDFCGTPDKPVVHTFPAHDVDYRAIELPGGKTSQVTSVGGWCACIDCKQLVDAGDRHGLTRHCASAIVSYDQEAAAVDRGELEHLIDALHVGFWQHRKGDEW